MASRLAIIALCVAGPVLLTAQAPSRPGDRPPARLRQPRIPPLPEAQWTDAQRNLAQKYSGSDNAFRTLLNVPQIVDSVMPLAIYLSEESTLTPRHRELLILRTAWLCGNESLWPVHAARARTAGLTTREIRRVAEGPDAAGWASFERTLLQLADQLYRNSAVTDRTWRELASSYDVYHLMDAVETVNHFTFLSLMYNSFGVQPDAGAADRLPADIPYRVVVPEREPPLTAARISPVEGTGIAVSRTFARYPKLNAARAPRAGFVNRLSPLSPRHREMLILRMGWDCQSEYEWAQHVGRVGRAREHGLDPLRIAQGPERAEWDPFEATLLRAADELYRDAAVSDTSWKALAARFDTASLMSAVLTASSYRATSMALNALGVQLEPGDERFPRLASQ
ncbi:MAG TPA: carboxymuconolactone decarboxylase family protein [Bryobacteraceae bacterium]|nr:carboxymuconolactone decarboxylase family protein [Bryobacteraceae bacterium]